MQKFQLIFKREKFPNYLRNLHVKIMIILLYPKLSSMQKKAYGFRFALPQRLYLVITGIFSKGLKLIIILSYTMF